MGGGGESAETRLVAELRVGSTLRTLKAMRQSNPVMFQFSADPLMIPLAMIVLDELRDHVPEVPLAEGNEAFGARSGVRTTRMPAAPSRCRTTALHFRSRSQISTR